jgi:hypothetical protein
MQKKIKEDEEIAKCTFSPNVNKKANAPIPRCKSSDVTKRLYSHAMNKLLRIKSIYEEKKAIDIDFEKDSKQCTFVPVTKQLYLYYFINKLEIAKFLLIILFPMIIL